MSYHPGVIEALRDWGLRVRESAGWATRGSEDFNPRGHILHHDVIGHTETLPQMLISGRPDLAGPLCNFWLPRSGVVWCVAAGRANHAGSGGWQGLTGNASVWGTEMNNRGTPDDEWPESQLEAMARLAAATADYSGYDPLMTAAHHEWTERKIDPHTIDMGAFRTQVRLQEKEGLSVADIEALRKTIIRQHQKDREQQRRIALREGRLSQAQTDEIVAAIEDD